MKTKAYVAVHQSIGIFTRIPSQRFIFIFIKWLVYKIHIYVHSVQRPFHLQRIIFLPNIWFFVHPFGKFQGCIRNQRQLAMQKTFQIKWSPKCLIWRNLGVLNIWKVFAWRPQRWKQMVHLPFQVFGSVVQRIWKVLGTLPEMFLYVLADSHRPRLIFISRKN